MLNVFSYDRIREPKLFCIKNKELIIVKVSQQYMGKQKILFIDSQTIFLQFPKGSPFPPFGFSSPAKLLTRFYYLINKIVSSGVVTFVQCGALAPLFCRKLNDLCLNKLFGSPLWKKVEGFSFLKHENWYYWPFWSPVIQQRIRHYFADTSHIYHDFWSWKWEIKLKVKSIDQCRSRHLDSVSQKIWVLTVICMQIMKFYFLIIKNPTFIRVLTPKICFAVPLTKNFCFTIPNAYLLRGGVRIFQGVGGAKLQFRKGECQRTRLRQRSNANAYLVFLPPSKSAHDSRKVEF